MVDRTGSDLQRSMEKGTLLAAMRAPSSLSGLNNLSLSQQEQLLQLFNACLNHAVDACPQRAQCMLREFVRMAPNP